MELSIIGTGYVGLPTGVAFASLGFKVNLIDINKAKINDLKNGNIDICEKNIKDLFTKAKNNINFYDHISKDIIKNSDIIFVAVGTPEDKITGKADMTYIYKVIEDLAFNLNENKYNIIAIKSTVPVHTGQKLSYKITSINNNLKIGSNIEFISIPEFLKEGSALNDFFNPDRIIIGSNNIDKIKDKIDRLYKYFYDKNIKILYLSREEAELSKYAANAFLALKIHYINEISNLCEKLNLDIDNIAKAIGSDKRIGDKFLKSGPGYGGSCFPKDTKALYQIGKEYDVNLSLVADVITGNEDRKKNIASKIIEKIKNNNLHKIIVLGTSFKAETDDIRESPAINIIDYILEELSDNISLHLYDPMAINNSKKYFAKKNYNNIFYYDDHIYDAIKDSDLIIIATEWNEFKNLDLEKIKKIAHIYNIIDLRRILIK